MEAHINRSSFQSPNRRRFTYYSTSTSFTLTLLSIQTSSARRVDCSHGRGNRAKVKDVNCAYSECHNACSWTKNLLVIGVLRKHASYCTFRKSNQRRSKQGMCRRPFSSPEFRGTSKRQVGGHKTEIYSPLGIVICKYMQCHVGRLMKMKTYKAGSPLVDSSRVV